MMALESCQINELKSSIVTKVLDNGQAENEAEIRSLPLDTSSKDQAKERELAQLRAQLRKAKV